MTDKTMWSVTDKNFSQDFFRTNQQSLGKTTMVTVDLNIWIIQKWLVTPAYHGFWDRLSLYLLIISRWNKNRLTEHWKIEFLYALHTQVPQIWMAYHIKYIQSMKLSEPFENKWQTWLLLPLNNFLETRIFLHTHITTIWL